MALKWSGGDELRAQNPTVVEASEGMTPYEKQLYRTLQHLSTALNIASSLPDANADATVIRDPAVVDILAQSAGILDRISTPAALATAMPMLLKIHEYYASQVCFRFYGVLKLGANGSDTSARGRFSPTQPRGIRSN